MNKYLDFKKNFIYTNYVAQFGRFKFTHVLFPYFAEGHDQTRRKEQSNYKIYLFIPSSSPV